MSNPVQHVYTVEELNQVERPNFISEWEMFVHSEYTENWYHCRARIKKYPEFRLAIRQAAHQKYRPYIQLVLNGINNGDTLFFILEYARKLRTLMHGARIELLQPDTPEDVLRLQIKHHGYLTNQAQQMVGLHRKQLEACRLLVGPELREEIGKEIMWKVDRWAMGEGISPGAFLSAAASMYINNRVEEEKKRRADEDAKADNAI